MMSNAAIKPIKTEKEYEIALSRIEVLMDAEEGTPEAEEIEVLVTQVELYEEEHYPIDFPDPISAIEFRMDQSGLSRRDLIPLIGSKAKISEVLSGKRALTLSMIRALHEHLHIPAEVLLGKPGATLPKTDVNIDWSKFPLSAMAKLGWIEPRKNLKDYAEEIMSNLIQRAGDFNNFSAALYRKNDGTRQNAKTDPYALKAWCYKLLATANEITLPAEYQNGSITKKFAQTLVKLSCSQDGPKRAKEYLAKHGIHLIPLPHLPHTHLDGAVLSLADGTPVIGLTLRYDRLDNFWFSLCHEIAHIALHLKKDSHNSFIDDLSLEPVDNIEVEADKWAKEVLIPSKLWNDSSLRPKPNSAMFLELPGLLPFACLSKTDNQEQVLREVARRTQTLPLNSSTRNIIAASAVLAGLVLKKDFIWQVLRQDIMRESVIYQEIEAEAEARGEARGLAKGKTQGLAIGEARGLAKGKTQGLAIGEARGEARGETRGLALKAQEIALSLLKTGMKVQQVAQVTGLPLERVLQLQGDN